MPPLKSGLSQPARLVRMSGITSGKAVLLFCLIIITGVYRGALLPHQAHSQPASVEAHGAPSWGTPEYYSSEWPQYIWQTAKDDGDTTWLNATMTWPEQNPTWTYTVLSDPMVDSFLEQHLSENAHLMEFWHDLQVPVLRADLFRYLALQTFGGVYSDIDTSCKRPISEWIPSEFRDSNIGAVVGVEYDDTTYKMFIRPMSFCQWTLMARPQHPLYHKVLQRVIYRLEYLARLQKVTLSQIVPDKMQILEATGPGSWSDAVLEEVRSQTGQHLQFQDFQGIKKPVLYGDVLLLPINAFGFGQKHSHSSDAAYGVELARHHFGKTWYKPKPTS